MKRGWLAAALLVAMAGLAGWHTYTLGSLTGELGAVLTRAEELAEAGDWDGADQATRTALERWDEKHFYLHATLEHDLTDEIALGFAETLEFIQCREEGEYSAANARLIAKLELLGELERPLPENLL